MTIKKIAYVITSFNLLPAECNFTNKPKKGFEILLGSTDDGPIQ